MSMPSAQLLELARARWNLSGEIRFIRRVANFVYESSIDGRPVILRLTEPSHRSCPEIEAELDWMSFLHRRGVILATPVQSRQFKLVEELNGEDCYFAAVFEKAEGRPLREIRDFSDAMIIQWGGYLGAMHRLTKQYIPAPHIQLRQQWDQDDTLKTALRSLDSNDKLAFEKLNDCLSWLGRLPQSPDSYGLVHGDLHQGNFFVKDREIMSFDYDDSCYHWFSYDIATSLFSMLNLSEIEKPSWNFETVAEPFLSGYLKENKLDQAWIDRVEKFTQFRAALIYHYLKTGMAEGTLDEKIRAWCRTHFPWYLRYMAKPLP